MERFVLVMAITIVNDGMVDAMVKQLTALCVMGSIFYIIVGPGLAVFVCEFIIMFLNTPTTEKNF